MTLLNNAVIQACDALDGVTDGVIDDPRKCTFDPAVLQCTGGTDAAGLPDRRCRWRPPTASTAARASRTASRSSRAYTRGSELGWTGLYTGATPGGSGWDFFRYAVFQDPRSTTRAFNFDTDIDRALNTQRRSGRRWPSIYNAGLTCRAFRARGGKLIMYHGWADQQITPLVQHRLPPAGAGGGGPGRDRQLPEAVHAAGHRPLRRRPGRGRTSAAAPALQRWRTRNMTWCARSTAGSARASAPTTLIGTRIATNVANRTRPLCPYPQVAKYKGSGSIDDAANFACVDPA